MKEKEKVNWRLQYRLDNIFNLFILIMIMVFYFMNPIFIPILALVGIWVNVDASGFFNKDRFE